MDADRFIAESGLRFDHPCRGRVPVSEIAADVDAARLGGRGEPYTAQDCPGGDHVFSSDTDMDAGGGAGFYLDLDDSDEVRRGDGPSAPVYWEFYDKRDGRTTAFVYWLFYGYNDFVNNHEGDWERVAVVLVDGRPDGVTFWKHNEDPCTVGWDDLDKADSHSVTYSAAGSHASYHRAGGYDATPGPGQPVTDVTSPGTRWPTWHDPRSVVEQPWWGYKGLWGDQTGTAGANGPRGPYPGRAESVFATEPCAEPLPRPTATPGPAPTGQPAAGVAEAFLGSWRSPEPADQPTSDTPYHVELTIRDGAVGERVGDIAYPGLDCSGSLTLVETAPDKLVVAEHIDAQPVRRCTVDGFVTLTPTPSGLHFSYERSYEPGSVSVTAELVRR